jgi:hypothetical protein
MSLFQRMLLGLTLSFFSVPALAQGWDVGVTGAGLLSMQPVDDSYVGGPYLSEGIGGFAPGFGGGLTIVAPNGFLFAAEYSTARFEQEQSGRLVRGCSSIDPCLAHTTRLRDSLLSGLAGVALSSGRTRFQLLGGVSARLDDPTIDDVPRDDDGLPVALTGGLDLLQSVSERAALVFGARYSYAERAETHQYLGIGPHVLRIAVGVRVRLN